MTTPTAFPLCWPAQIDRSRSYARSPFQVSMSRAVSDLKDALRLFAEDSGLPVTNVVISSNVTLGRVMPRDPGVAVYFDWDGAQRCIAVDKFARPESNVRAIFNILEARREELRFGGLSMVRASLAGLAALPAPDDWREVLGLGPHCTLDDAEAAFRRLAHYRHPDRGGDDAAMSALNAARAAAKKELVN